MPKKIVLLGLCIAITVATLYFLYVKNNSEQSTKNTQTISQKISPTSTPTPMKVTRSIFVPYWQLSADSDYSLYDTLYYFGISANSSGIDKSDPGFINLKKFTSSAQDKKRYLTLRMLDVDDNLSILENKKLQEKVIKETLQAAQDNGFTGVVLDLELGVLPLTAVVNKINTFTANFYLSAKQNNLTFMQAVYGDVFYRKRPFDVKYLAENSDGIIVMAYDFHKSGGDPGPNFPFKGREKYGYDFETMIENYLSVVPADKLTVTFGMFGYDWITDMEGKRLKNGTALSLNEIKQEYIEKCDWKNCVQRRDPEAGEMEINFVDSTSSSTIIYHKLWFEDESSVDQKMQFLKTKGIGSVAYWTYGYF
ncbi:MAG: glycosyl hydrolase family 18 protein [Patescibacteria group bacterium]